MQLHRYAKLGLRGRRELVLAIESGMSLKAAAAAFSVSPATAHRWWHRWRSASEQERGSLACLYDRSSRPKRCPRMLAAREQARICAVRRRSGWGPTLIADETGHAHATVWRALRRARLSRLPRPPRERTRRYEWPCPGDLLHIDSKRFSRFTRSEHAVTGVRDRTGAEERMHVGHEFVHSIVDDYSRLAYSELHPDERAASSSASSTALAFFDSQSIRAKRLMSDNAWAYTKNRALRQLLQRGSELGGSAGEIGAVLPELDERDATGAAAAGGEEESRRQP